MKNTPIIVDAVRSPMGRGKSDGVLTGIHAVELLAQTLKGLVDRNELDPGIVDDLLIGCVTQIGEQSAVPGRMAWLAAGFPEHVPASTIDRRCGSGQQAIHFAAQGIMAGAYDVVIAGGVEMMSHEPMGSNRIGKDSFGPSVQRRYAPGVVKPGVAAELIAQKWRLSREDLDRYAFQSHRRAAQIAASGEFEREIVPIKTETGTVTKDETIRADSNLERLAQLKPSFASSGMIERFPEIEWKMTAGNASQITDGAAALLIMSEERANILGLSPLARFVAFDVIADDPMMMLTAPIPATRRVLGKARMAVQNIDHFEVNEAFASVPLAWQRELDVDPTRLNPRGGAIALGHPLGASGARLMTTMLHALTQTKGRYGLQTMCEHGGMANATIIERL